MDKDNNSQTDHNLEDFSDIFNQTVQEFVRDARRNIRSRGFLDEKPTGHFRDSFTQFLTSNATNSTSARLKQSSTNRNNDVNVENNSIPAPTTATNYFPRGRIIPARLRVPQSHQQQQQQQQQHQQQHQGTFKENKTLSPFRPVNRPKDRPPENTDAINTSWGATHNQTHIHNNDNNLSHGSAATIPAQDPPGREDLTGPPPPKRGMTAVGNRRNEKATTLLTNPLFEFLNSAKEKDDMKLGKDSDFEFLKTKTRTPEHSAMNDIKKEKELIQKMLFQQVVPQHFFFIRCNARYLLGTETKGDRRPNSHPSFRRKK